MNRIGRYGVVFAGVLLALGVATWLWLRTPPGAARLLPECDAILYANVKPLRSATHFDRTPVSRAPEYQAFVDATGIVPERDLDAIALAMHRMDDPRGPNGPVAYSEVFEGRFDPARLERYLASIAAVRESYAGKTIFSVLVGEVSGASGRRLRVAVLDRDRIVASNAPTTEQIHALLDRGRSGPSLLAARYGDVPHFASAWGLGRLGLPVAEGGWLTIAGLRLPVPEDADFVASLRYLGRGVNLRVEELAGSDLNAARTAQELSPMLTLVRAIAENQPNLQSTPLREAYNSITVEAKKDRVVLRGVLPVKLLRGLAGSQAAQAPR